MKYNVGDKVRIKSRKWYNKNKDKDGNVYFDEHGIYVFSEDEAKFCGKTLTVYEVDNWYHVYFLCGCGIDKDDDPFVWTEDMIECKVEE